MHLNGMNRIKELEAEIENIKEWNVKIIRKKDDRISALERKLKIAEEVIKNAEMIARCYSELCEVLSDHMFAKSAALSQIELVKEFLKDSSEALSAIREE